MSPSPTGARAKKRTVSTGSDMIRPPRPEDARALAVVHITSWQHAYEDDFPSEFLESLDMERRVAWFGSQIEKGSGLLVADGDDGPVGFCFFGESGDEGWGEVFSIYVHPEKWGEGHGHRLLVAAEAELIDRGFDKALLWVLDSNRRARDFYEREGWVLGKPIRLEEIGGRQVTEVRYERVLGGRSRPDPGRRGR